MPQFFMGASNEECVPFMEGCQTFVSMGCSPLVAADRSQIAALNEEKSMAVERDGDEGSI